MHKDHTHNNKTIFFHSILSKLFSNKIALVCMFSLLIFVQCKKPVNNNTGPSAMYAQMYFPIDTTTFWKAYYYAPSGWDHMYKYAIDSIFLSTDTVQVNTITYTNPIPVIKTYQILKVFRTGVRFGTPYTWDTEGVSNFSAIRIDTANGKVYRLHTPTYTYPGGPINYPTSYHLIEGLLYDHYAATGDTTSLFVGNNTYHCNIHIDSVPFGPTYLKRQFFTSSTNFDTISHRMQLGCIFNSTTWAFMATPCLEVPNAYITKLTFYRNLNDSIEISLDTRIYP